MGAVLIPVEWFGFVGYFVFLVLPLVGFIALMVLLIGRARRRELDRQVVLRQWASTAGWSYVPSPTVDWITRLPGRHRGRVSLLLSGTLSGRPVSVAEYSYTERRRTTGSHGTGRSTFQTHRFVVVVVTLGRSMPDLTVQPRVGLSQLARTWFGGGTQSTGTFDQQFRLLGDTNAAGAAIPPALLGEHVAGTVPPWSVHGTELVSYVGGWLQDPGTIPELVAPLLRVADHLDPQP